MARSGSRPRSRLHSAVTIGFATLALVGAFGLVEGLVGGGESAAAGRAVALTTPVLSARRVPGAMRVALARDALQSQVVSVLAGPDVAAAAPTSCVVVRVAGGNVAAIGTDREIMPASTLKVLTAVGVLGRIDESTRFVTTVRATAKPAGGVLHGDLWIVGGGDPLLESADYTKTQEHAATDATSLDQLADAVVAAGIHEIDGKLVGDGRRYDDVRLVPSWKRSYVTDGEVGPLGALMIDDNFTVINAKGTRVAASDVPADAASELGRMLAARGVVLADPNGTAATGAAADVAAPEPIAQIESEPLGAVIGEMLRWSDNTTAEMLTKELGYRTVAKGTTKDGIAAIRASLTLRGIDVSGMHTVDGSGLDRSDRVTCPILAAAVETQPPDGPFAQGLPIMGQTGTLRRRLRGTAASGKVHAKTGSLDGVSSLAGRAEASDGSVIDFAIAFNGLRSTDQGRAAGDAISEALVAFPNAPTIAELGPQR